MTSFIDALKMEHEKTNLPELKIAYADFWPEWDDENFIEPILRKHFYVTLDQNNPDVLFHSIFGGMKETQKYKCEKILFLGENWRPGQFKSDYSISFDPHSETNFRLPLWQIYLLLRPELKGRLFNRLNHDTFERFCSFTVSNPSNQTRNRVFDEISAYKRVHSYGKVRMNDFGLNRASQGKYWREAKDKFFLDHTHKFSIAFENTSYPGYCTEKLMDSFLAGSLPLYWGDPKVKEDWNPKAFINVNDYRGYLEEIKRIDENKEYFDQYYHEPVFTEDQKDKLLNNLGEFEEWLIEKIEK